ncbi:MAG: hypothetical protein KAW46_03715, partial [candidate division Zixibacteria bacterium]|nr:hypothetical protein [candidate division Zixibacteria bacterium]
MIKKAILLVCVPVLVLSLAALADWSVGDDHKMHHPQLPDEAGWDVNATQPLVLADDFMCMETGWIKDIHWWGSWRHGEEGEILYFVLSLHEDIPAEESPTGYSMPGTTLWESEISYFTAVPIDPPTMEGWLDPYRGDTIWDDHQAYFQYNVFLPEAEWYPQDSGTIYWLNISAVLEDTINFQWGWKSTQDHWNDDAVWALWGDLSWNEMYEPEAKVDTLMNDFFITIDPGGQFIGGGGTGFFGTGWYYYPDEEWWNIWFYDHPYDPERYKEAFIEFDVFPRGPGSSYIELAINWSTDQWSLDQPPGDSMPPLPGVNEDLYIGRELLFVMQDADGHYMFPWIWPEYNPEWVSIDVRGFNFIIPGGVIMHACVAEGTGESMDLSFVINSRPTGACCDPLTGDCYVTTAEGCTGDYMGDGTDCNPNPCPQPTGACCNPVTGGCTITTEAACAGDWMGAWTTCDPNPCPQPTGACCDPTGQCYVTERATCLGAGHEYHGDWTTCSGDLNGNGIDDRCEDLYWEPGDGHKMHFPQLPDENGWDVNGSLPIILADDWICSETGPVKDIHWWGSWKDGFEGQISGFALSIHRDIPADPPQIPWSRPGEIIWQKVVTDFNPQQINPFTLEGWYDPLTQLVLPDNHSQYFQYNVYLGEEDWFMQDSGTIYWLNISAGPIDAVEGLWGWKTSIEHFNDDGVWGIPTCTEPDNGGGTITLPADCNIIGDEPMMIIDGFPPGTTIEMDAEFQTPFTCQHDQYPCSLPLAQGVCEGSGGSMGGDGHCFEATLDLDVTGTGSLAGFNRHLAVLVALEVHTALRTPGDDLQKFDAMVFTMYGELFGDPDFCEFIVIGGSDFGLPGPGQITLAKRPDGTFEVESFFDITYQIEFEGCPGSMLDGYAGITTATARFHQGGTDWVELLDPASGQSLDLAFVITGGEETCCMPPMRGNIDMDPLDQIDISDLV